MIHPQSSWERYLDLMTFHFYYLYDLWFKKSLLLCQQPNKFLAPLARVLTVLVVWIDILEKVKFVI